MGTRQVRTAEIPVSLDRVLVLSADGRLEG
jgi:hypothetical protein